jgi:hypothetical protein
MKLTIMFFLLMMLVACSSVDTKEPVSEIDNGEPVIVEGEWKEVEREERKIGTSLTITNANK